MHGRPYYEYYDSTAQLLELEPFVGLNRQLYSLCLLSHWFGIPSNRILQGPQNTNIQQIIQP